MTTSWRQRFTEEDFDHIIEEERDSFDLERLCGDVLHRFGEWHVVMADMYTAIYSADVHSWNTEPGDIHRFGKPRESTIPATTRKSTRSICSRRATTELATQFLLL